VKQNLNQQTKEFSLSDMLTILAKYKWSIVLITLFTVMIGSTYIHFKAPIYESYSIIKVKANETQQTEDVINNSISTTKSKDVLEEISLLKTFKVNSRSLDIVDFKTHYYVKRDYKKVEIYTDDSPIEITNIQIFDPEIVGKMLTITPVEKGFNISYKASYKNKLKKTILQDSIFRLKDFNKRDFNQLISNKQIRFKIRKKIDFFQPVSFIIFGQKRDIFEKLIINKLNIEQLEKDTSLIKISFTDTIPLRANLYVDALTKSFIDYSIESKNTQNHKTLDFITEELKNIKKELKRSEQKLESHQISKNIVKPSEQAALYIQNLSNIEIKISENNLRKKLINNLISFVKNNYNLDAIAPSISKLNDQNTLGLITKLQDYQIAEEELTLEYTDEYPKLKTTRKQILNIRNKIQYNLDTLRKNIDYVNTNLKTRKATYESDMQTLPSKERELVNIKRNYEVKSKMYEYLLRKQAENKIIQLATFSDYQIIDNAYNTFLPIEPVPILVISISLVIGLLISSLLAFIRYSRNIYIQNKEDIEKMTVLPLYGSIPYYKQRKNSLTVNKVVKSPFSESFRTLRTNLQFINYKGEKGKTILISSTIAGEGKSTTSANLATILEMAQYKTIIVNFDLRKPSLHKFFDITTEKGVSSYLSGKNTLDEVIMPTEFANLDIITAGPIPANPSELILSKKVPLMIEMLKEKYQYVIIDTAPIGIVSDTKTIMRYSDLNLIIIREDYARKDFLLTIEAMIEQHSFSNVGLILNASKDTTGEYGYGYSYEYE